MEVRGLVARRSGEGATAYELNRAAAVAETLRRCPRVLEEAHVIRTMVLEAQRWLPAGVDLDDFTVDCMVGVLEAFERRRGVSVLDWVRHRASTYAHCWLEEVTARGGWPSGLDRATSVSSALSLLIGDRNEGPFLWAGSDVELRTIHALGARWVGLPGEGLTKATWILGAWIGYAQLLAGIDRGLQRLRVTAERRRLLLERAARRFQSTPLMPGSELWLLLQVLEVARQTRWRVAALNWPNGTPDLIIQRGSRWLAIELKSASESVSRRQREILEKLHQKGYQVQIWRPSDLEKIREELCA